MNCRVYLSIAGENRIARYGFDPDTGGLSHEVDTLVSGSPGPLAPDPDERLLYAGLRSSREMASFRLDRSTGDLTPTAVVSLESDPCYIRTDRTGRFLLSTYYRAGRVSCHRIADDGAVTEERIEWIATAEHAHCIQTDRSNRFAFVPHTVEPNYIAQFRFDEATGNLTPNDPSRVAPPNPDGPRHICWHPTLDALYASNENGCSVTAYRFDPSAGTIAPFQTLSTLPEDFDGSNTCAQIHMTPNGRYVYATNRGHDSVAGFAVDSETGEMTPLGQTPSETTPRVFGIDPTGAYLYAAGQATGRLAAYRIDGDEGALQPLRAYSVGENPMWVQFIRLDD